MRYLRQLVMALVLGSVGSIDVARAQYIPSAIYENPSAEAGAASPDGNSVVVVPGWQTTGSFTVVQYGTAGPFPSVPFEDSTSPQANFFVGGATSTLSTATQLVALTGDVEWFESYPNWYHLWVSASLGGWRSDTAGPRIRLELLDAAQSPISMRVISHTSNDVHVINPANPSMIGVRFTEPAPPGFRYLRVTLELEGLPGEYNSSLIDDLFIGFVYPDAVEPTSWSRIKTLEVE